MILVKRVSYLAMATLLLTGTGCSKFGDINTNPNEVEVPVTSALLTNVETTLSGLAMPSNLSYYVQYYSQIQYPAEQLYSETSIGWDATYNNPLKDLQNIIDVNTAKPDPGAFAGNTKNQIQIARILRAYIYMTLTDRYGDIPYFQAVKGESKVAYDKQQAIYADLFKELKEANASFENAGEPIHGDIIYGGNLALWKKFANSLRMVMAMNLSKVDAAKSEAEFKLALNDPNGYIADNDENFALKYPGGSFNFPYYYKNLVGASEIALSGTVSDKLKASNDPRLKAYGQEVGGKVKGIPYGMDRAHTQTWLASNPDYSQIYAMEHKQASSTATILPAAYVYLLRAEGALRYATGENAYNLLRNAIEQSLEQWSVSGDATAYLAGMGINSSADVTLAVIQEQKWIALFGSSQLAWNEWRRTGIPNLAPAPDAQNASKSIPRRYGYPTTERALNADAYNAAVAAFPYGGSDVHNNRVWWDKP